jgi:hypothetical protein
MERKMQQIYSVQKVNNITKKSFKQFKTGRHQEKKKYNAN